MRACVSLGGLVRTKIKVKLSSYAVRISARPNCNEQCYPRGSVRVEKHKRRSGSRARLYKVCKPCHLNVLHFILAIIVRTTRDLHSRIRIRIRFNAKMGAYTRGWGRAYNQIKVFFCCFLLVDGPITRKVCK